jgi:Putative auto-transporter adhesin, head GIN domain
VPRVPFLLLLTLGAGLLLVSCTSTRGSGNIKTETRQVQGFTEVEAHGSGDLTIDQTGTESLSIQAEDNLLPLLESKVADGHLSLGPKAGTNIQPTSSIHYRLTVRDLRAVRLSGSTTATVRNVSTPNLETDISGSGKVTLSGQAIDQRVSISGSGAYLADQLTGQTARISLAGSGDAKIRVSDTLDVKISGSGTVTYLGSPHITQDISGSGSVRPA